MSLLDNIKKRGFKDILSPNRWKAFIVWILRRMLTALGGEAKQILSVHEIENIVYRMRTCSECVEQGTCVHCGCNTMGRMQEPTESCSAGKWGPFYEPERWRRVKKKLNFKL